MEQNGKFVWIGVIVFAIIVAGLAIFYPYQRPAKIAPLSTTQTLAPPPPAEPENKTVHETQDKDVPFVRLPSLRESDGWLREKARVLSANKFFGEWLKSSNLVRRITAAVHNVAEGASPRPHLTFLAPRSKFAVVQKQEKTYLKVSSYTRYDLVADAFSSLDMKQAAGIFDLIEPVFQDAYRELGYPKKNFRRTLIGAIRELLETPIVEGEIALEEKVLSYRMSDEELENLSAAQKDLLRMGPQNTRKIQGKLREFALALGVPVSEIPKPQIYATSKH